MAPKKKKEAVESIDSIIKTLQGRFGAGSVQKLSDAAMDVHAISTGSFSLDAALGVGGYPKGRIIEIFGPESSGKTTLALHAVAEAQKEGGTCAYIDSEYALDPNYAKDIGVDIDALVISQPDTGEDALDMVQAMVETNRFAVIVVDSVAALTPRSEVEGDMDTANVGRHPKMMSKAMRKLVPVVSKSSAVIIMINQIRINIGGMPGSNPEYTPGGKALKFSSSVRIDIRRIAQIKKGEEVVGSRTKIKVVKNKVAAPYKQTVVDIMYGQGISYEGELLALGEKHKILEKAGNAYRLGDLTIGRGYDAARIYLKANPATAQILRQKVTKAIEEQKGTPTQADLMDDQDGALEETDN